MRALYLSLFLMVFFLIFSLLTSFSAFAGFDTDTSGITNGNESLTEAGITGNIETLKDDSFKKIDTIKTDNSVLSVLSTILYGLKMILSVIISTIRYLLFFADVLILWGTPLIVAGFIQLMIYLSYVITLIEIFGVKK